VALEDVRIPHAELQHVEVAVIGLEGLIPNGIVVILHCLCLHLLVSVFGKAPWSLLTLIRSLLVSVFQTHDHVLITLGAYIETREIASAIHTNKQYAGKLRRSYFTLGPLLDLNQRAYTHTHTHTHTQVRHPKWQAHLLKTRAGRKCATPEPSMIMAQT
jgi:hypothetical protein